MSKALTTPVSKKFICLLTWASCSLSPACGVHCNPRPCPSVPKTAHIFPWDSGTWQQKAVNLSIPCFLLLWVFFVPDSTNHLWHTILSSCVCLFFVLPKQNVSSRKGIFSLFCLWLSPKSLQQCLIYTRHLSKSRFNQGTETTRAL